MLEMGIVKWTEYEDKFKECEQWLARMEGNVQGYNKLQNTAQEKRAVLEEFQAHLQSIFDWQKTLDLLNIRAQLLLETCADSRVSNAVTQLTTKYNILLSMAKEVMRRLEMHFQEHQQHDQLFAECSEWIETTREKLDECDSDSGTASELQENLASVKAIKNSLEQGQHKLRYVLELKERVIMNTEQTGAADIQKKTESLRQTFEELISDIYSSQQEISACLSRSAETEKMCQDAMEWLDEIDIKTNEQGVLFSDLSEKRGALEKYRIIIRDIAVHHDMMDRLSNKKVEDSSAQEEVDECITKYEGLKSKVAKNIKILEGYVKHHEAYHQAYMEAVEWLRKMNIEVQQSSDSHGNKELAESNLSKQEELKDQLLAGEAIVNKAVTLCKNLLDTTSEEGKEPLTSEVENLKQDWNELQNKNGEYLRTLQKCLKAWDDFQDSYDSLQDWLTQFKEQIEGEPSDPTPEDLEAWQVSFKHKNQKRHSVQNNKSLLVLYINMLNCNIISNVSNIINWCHCKII